MLRRIVLAALASLVVVPALAAESTYTRLDVDACRPVSVATETDWFEGLCPGYAEWPVYYTEIDLRVRIAYGENEMDDTRLWGGFASFNHVHHTIEWRLGFDGAPYATIHRWFVSGLDGRPDRQVLMIHRVTQPGVSGCTVGMIDASVNANANVLAREVADDVVRGFACGRDRAQWYGRTDAGTPESTLSW